MSDDTGPAVSAPVRVLGIVMLLLGASVFLVRLQHPGPYAMPAGGNLLGGVLALAIGGWLVRDWLGGSGLVAPLRWLALAVSPVALFLALYATMAELEEVVVLKVVDRSGEPTDLRLWIADHEGAEWVAMPRSKAEAHGLTATRADLLRDGELRCVVAVRHEDRETVDRIDRVRAEKYVVQQIATRIGMFGENLEDPVVVLRLEACPDA